MRFKKWLAGLGVIIAVALAVPQVSYATVSNTTTETQTGYGNGSTTNFTITFDFRSNTWITVTEYDTSTNPATVTSIPQGSGAGKFTVSGGNPGTTVVMGTAPTSTQYLLIARSIPLVQPVVFNPASIFPYNGISSELDQLTLALQNLNAGLGNGSTATGGSVSGNLPATGAPYDFIGWNAAGQSTVNATTQYDSGQSTFQTGDIVKFNGTGWSTYLFNASNLIDTINLGSTPLGPGVGGSGVSNSGFLTWGSHALTFTTTGNTNVTLPTSGTLLAGTADNNNTPSTFVKRDSSGNFAGNSITGSLFTGAFNIPALATNGLLYLDSSKNVVNGTFSGSTHQAVTLSGLPISGKCAQFDGLGNITATSDACGSGGGGGGVTTYATLADFPSSGADGDVAIALDTHNLYMYDTGTAAWQLIANENTVVAIGTGHGLTISANALSLALASTSTTGAISSTDWNTFNGKQSALTFSAPLVNTTGTVTCNASSGSQAGCLSSIDWTTFNGKQAGPLTGDGTTSGAALTLATVATAGTTGSSTSIPAITIDVKGRVTGVTGNAVIAPAGTLSGTTLNSTVVSSSLTSVGTISTGTWSATAIAIAKGGTGQATQTAAFDALSPATTKGDVIVYSGTHDVRLGVGTDTFVVTANSAATNGVDWEAAPTAKVIRGGTGQDLIGRAFFAGGTSSTSCSSSPCTVYSQTGSAGDWLAASNPVTRSGTGAYVLAVVSGAFTAAPICSCVAAGIAAAFETCQYKWASSSATSLQFFIGSGVTAADDGVSVICVGPH